MVNVSRMKRLPVGKTIAGDERHRYLMSRAAHESRSKCRLAIVMPDSIEPMIPKKP